MKQVTIFIALITIVGLQAHSQKLGKRLKQVAKQSAENKAEQKTAEAVDVTLEKSVNGVKNIFNKKSKNKEKDNDNDNNREDVNNKQPVPDAVKSADINSGDTTGTEFGIYSMFTFVPGNKVLFYDDFAADGLGDFPALWETGGSGEVVSTSQYEGKWLSLNRRSGYLPITKKELPENYTVEFDFISNGYGTNALSKLFLAFLPKKAYSMAQAGSVAYLELLLKSHLGVVRVENFGSEVTNRVTNRINRNMTDLVNSKVHVSIAVNGKRLRIWLDNEKYVDAPNILQGKLGRYFIVEAFDVKPENNQFVAISNFRIAEASEDLRSLLLKNGRFTTTGIYFNTNSSVVKKESYGTIKSIADMLTADAGIKIKIVGHTDSDGDPAINQDLSVRRAESVKKILVKDFGIDASRLQFDGKGEAEPADDNSTEKGKANNRRVEFIKL